MLAGGVVLGATSPDSEMPAPPARAPAPELTGSLDHMEQLRLREVAHARVQRAHEFRWRHHPRGVRHNTMLIIVLVVTIIVLVVAAFYSGFEKSISSTGGA